MGIDTKMKQLCDEVREISGTTSKKSIDNLIADVSAANNIISEQGDTLSQIITLIDTKATSSDGTNTNDATATADDILSGKTAYVKGQKITGTIESVNRATLNIAIDSNGLIETTASQDTGYVTAGVEKMYMQLAKQAAKTITPSTSTQTAVAKNVYTTGDVKVAPIPSDYVIPSGTRTITTNGTYDVKSYASVYVDVASGGSSGGSIETCTVTITNNSDETCDIYGTWFDDGYISSYAKSVADGDTVVGVAVKNSFLIMPHGNYMPGIDFEDTIYWDSVGNPVYLIKLSLDTVRIDI